MITWSEDGLGSLGFPGCQEEVEGGEGWLGEQIPRGSWLTIGGYSGLKDAFVHPG